MPLRTTQNHPPITNRKYNLDDIQESRSLVEHVCFRPNLHTPSGSLEEVYSFLNALTHSAIETEKSQAKTAIAWLHSRAEFRNSEINFDRVRQKHGTDSEVIQMLLETLRSQD